MPRTEIIKNNFNGGIISPYILGRTDLAKYQNALEECTNFIPMVQGGITRRPGTLYVADATGPSRLIPFILSIDQSYILEFGNKVLRFYITGANPGVIISGSVPYEISTPYDTTRINEIPKDDLWDIKFVQIISVMYLVHPNHPPLKLIRINDTNWQLIQPRFYGEPTYKFDQNISQNTISIAISNDVVGADSPVFIAGDVGKAVVAGTGVGFITAVQGITSIDSNTGATRYLQAILNIVNPFDLTGYDPLHWKLRGGPLAYFSVGHFDDSNNQWTSSHKFGFGKTINIRATTGHPSDHSYQRSTGSSYEDVTYTGGFTDSFRKIDEGNYVPFAGGYCLITEVINSTKVTGIVLSIPTVTELDAFGNQTIAPTPPGAWAIESPAFGPENYPRAITLLQDRLWLGGTSEKTPNTLWGSGTGDYENFALGTLDTSSIRVTVNSGILEQVLWLEAFQGNLVIGTQKGEYLLNGGAGQAVQSAGAPITPSNLNVIRQSLYGIDRIQPLNVDNDLIFVQKSKNRAYEFAYNAITSAYGSKNLNILNEFVNFTGFKEMAYQSIPFKIIWFTENTEEPDIETGPAEVADLDLDRGRLIGLTYDKEQDVWAWHTHITGAEDTLRSEPSQRDSVVSMTTVPGLNGISDETWLLCRRKRGSTVTPTWTTPLETNGGDELADLSQPCIASNGTIFVTGGDGNNYNNALIYWSTDPANIWNLVDLGPGFIYNIIWCSSFNKFIASGAVWTPGNFTSFRVAIWTSPDGQVWTPFTTFSSPPSGNVVFTQSFFNGITFYTIGVTEYPTASTFNYLVSTIDGINFIEQTHSNPNIYFFISAGNATWDSILNKWFGILVNGSNNPTIIASSPDFFNWTTVYDGTSENRSFGQSPSVRRVGNTLVAFAANSSDTQRLLSSDGINWTPTAIVPDAGLFKFNVQEWIAAPDGTGIGARIYDGTGNSTRFTSYYSADTGIHWVLAGIDGFYKIRDAGSDFISPRYVAISVGPTKHILFSDDLQSYTQESPPDYLNNQFADTYFDGTTAIVAGTNIPASNGGAAISVWMGGSNPLRYTIEQMRRGLLMDYSSFLNSDTPVSQISGLEYLNGRKIWVVADGFVLPSIIMDSSGIYKFPSDFKAKDIQVGLNFECSVLTVRPEPKTTVQGLIKRWLKIWARLYRTVGLSIGTMNNQDIPFRTPQIHFNDNVPEFTGDVNINNLGYDRDGRVSIMQKNPLPCTVLAIFGSFEVSDGI